MRKRIVPAAIICLLCLICCLLSKNRDGRNAAPEEAPNVILDCDMGFMNDDALALSLLLRGEEAGKLTLLGITLEGGNHFVSADYENDGALMASQVKNTADLLAAVGRSDVPVIKGTDYPMGYSEENVEELAEFFEQLTYLEDCGAYGAIHYFDRVSSGELSDCDDAADFLIAAAREHSGSLVIIAAGPTMNIARAVAKDPSFSSRVSAIYYMGGAFGEAYSASDTESNPVTAVGGANVSPYCEYNACYDALSLETCLTANFPRQYVSPGELHFDIDQPAVMERLKTAGGRDDPFTALWLDYYESNIQDYPYWDPALAATFLRPESAIVKHGYVTINTDRSDEHYAMTSFSEGEEYSRMSDEEKALWGEADLIIGFENFWDFAIDILQRGAIYQKSR